MTILTDKVKQDVTVILRQNLQAHLNDGEWDNLITRSWSGTHMYVDPDDEIATIIVEMLIIKGYVDFWKKRLDDYFFGMYVPAARCIVRIVPEDLETIA